MDILIHCILSVLFGYSLSVIAVEKGDNWPVTIFTKPLRFLFNKIYSKLGEVLDCTVCCSFWTTLIGELLLKFWIDNLFLWPFTGIIAVGITWSVIEILNALDK